MRALTGPRRASALLRALNLTVNHGADATARLLSLGRALPPVGGLRPLRDGLARKRLSVLFNEGRHDEVLRLTRRLGDQPVSTPLLLRAGSERMTGSLDAAADHASRALSLARAEGHPVRTANAALQLCYALLWAGRLDEARQAHDLALLPYAGLAATRWVAWAGVIDASLLVHEGDPHAAVASLDLAQSRFTAEALVDGLVSVLTVRLTALRQAHDDGAYRDTRRTLAVVLDGRPAGTYHARGHTFTREAIMLEDGQFAIYHEHLTDAGRRLLSDVARSRYPLHSALGHLTAAYAGLDIAAGHAHQALRLAEQVGAREVADRARRLLAGQAVPPIEMFFP